MISLMKKYSYNEDRQGGKKWYQKVLKYQWHLFYF